MKIPLKNSYLRYGLISQFLHWSVALLFFIQFIWAWRIEQLGLGRQRFDLVNQHKSMGLTILFLMLLRIAWRYFNPPPLLPVTMSEKERQLARSTHYLLYALLLVNPLLGWAMSSAAGFVVSWFDVFDLPALLAQDDALKKLLRTLHAIVAWSIAVIVLGHIAAALRHHFVKKDNVLKRMLPLWKKQ